MTPGNQNFYLFKTQRFILTDNFVQSENKRHRGAISNELCAIGRKA